MIFDMEKSLLDISELSKELNLINKKTGKPANHILRFWEKEFKEIKPTVLKGKRRFYDKNQINKRRIDEGMPNQEKQTQRHKLFAFD